jgi:hypothetical protein
MSKLVDLLKSKTVEKKQHSKKMINVMEKKIEEVETSVVSPNVDGIAFDITDVEMEQIRASVVEIDTTDKNRNQIIIGMYGSIKNPRTGKRFVIPGVDYTSENYTYEYADMMRTLVNRPDDFKKIMNWE